MVSGTANGTAMPAQLLTTMKRVATGNQVTITMGERTFFKATFTLDTTRTPRTIDYKMTEGATAGGVQLGIYEIKGDTVRFSMSEVGGARPADFSTTQGDGRTVSIWVRNRN